MVKITDHKLFGGDTVREIQIYRPPVNAFNAELLESLKAAIEGAPAEGIRGLVISGGGSVFSAGMDIKETVTAGKEDITRTFQALKDVTLAIGLSEIPIAMAINGNCLGAGAVFSLFADYRVMSKVRANFGITEVRGGMTMGNHVLFALSRIIGEHMAMRFILEATTVDSLTAHKMGLVDQIVGPQFVTSRAVAWVGRLLKLPPSSMNNTREIQRAELVAKLKIMQAEPIETRVDEWFNADVQNTLKKLLKV